MQNPIYVMVSGQLSLARRLETVAQNIANANTAGFHAAGVKFDSLVSPVARVNNGPVNFVSTGRGYLSTNHGAFTETGNALDFAVKGDAYFALQTLAGPVYTRDGRFSMSANGDLLSVTGAPVLDDGGAPIMLDPAGPAPIIAKDGALYQGGQRVGKLGLFMVPKDAHLAYGAHGGIRPDRAAVPVEEGQDVGVLQGYIESSNVNGVLQMTQLIEISRAFDQLDSALRQQEETRAKALAVFAGKR